MMMAMAINPRQQILTIRMIKIKVIMITIKNTTSNHMSASIRTINNNNNHNNSPMEVVVTTMKRAFTYHSTRTED